MFVLNMLKEVWYSGGRGGGAVCLLGLARSVRLHDPTKYVCHGACLSFHLCRLALTVHVGNFPICTFSSLTGAWALKWGPSLRSSWAMTASSLSNTFTR